MLVSALLPRPLPALLQLAVADASTPSCARTDTASHIQLNNGACMVCLQDQQQVMEQMMWQQLMTQQQQQAPGCSRSRHKAATAEAATLQQQMQQMYEQMMSSMSPGEDKCPHCIGSLESSAVVLATLR